MRDPGNDVDKSNHMWPISAMSLLRVGKHVTDAKDGKLRTRKHVTAAKGGKLRTGKHVTAVKGGKHLTAAGLRGPGIA